MKENKDRLSLKGVIRCFKVGVIRCLGFKGVIKNDHCYSFVFVCCNRFGHWGHTDYDYHGG